MDIDGRVAIITGAGRGIGAAIASGLAGAGGRVAVVDLDAEAAATTASTINTIHPGAAIAQAADVSSPTDLARIVADTEAELGPVDIFCANAGVFGASGLGDAASWVRTIEVNLLAHVHAAELLIPTWIERGGGCFVSTASAAGLLTQLGMAQYTTTKHAALAFAEWLAITYGQQGIRVSCLCPMGVDTDLLHAAGEAEDGLMVLAADAVASAGEVLSPDVVAAAVLSAIIEERFLILPHPEVLAMYQRKAQDPDRWLADMRRYQSRLAPPR